MSQEIILHHYDTSPFSEKARLLLGLRGLPWRSVIQPSIMPKPDLVPLTGGYRRAPVMQVGADIFCDSQVILAEIDRRAGVATDALGWAINLWADRVFFQSSVAVIFGEIGEMVPRAFIEDREKLSGRPFDIAAMKAASGPMRAQWRSQAGWIDDALAGGRDFLRGETPGLADIAAYMNIWFMVNFAPQVGGGLLEGLSALTAWQERVRTIGHGHRSEMTTAEAVEIARRAEPSVQIDHDPHEPSGLRPGDRVAVSADDYGRDSIVGDLVAANRERMIIRREDARVDIVQVHFPRAGYIVAPAA